MNGAKVVSGSVLRVAVRVAGANRGLRAPEVVVVLRRERRDEAVVDGHVEQGEGPRVVRERPALRDGHLSCGRVQHETGRGRGVEPRHVRPILRPLRAVDAADRLHLEVVLRVLAAGERRRGIRA